MPPTPRPPTKPRSRTSSTRSRPCAPSRSSTRCRPAPPSRAHPDGVRRGQEARRRRHPPGRRRLLRRPPGRCRRGEADRARRRPTRRGARRHPEEPPASRAASRAVRCTRRRPCSPRIAAGAAMPLPRSGSRSPSPPGLSRPPAPAPRPRRRRSARRLGAIFDTTERQRPVGGEGRLARQRRRSIFERNPRLLVMPASTMKVRHAGRRRRAARLGRALHAPGSRRPAPIEDGVLPAISIVTGGGDPTIGEARRSAARPRRVGRPRCALLGVSRIDGRADRRRRRPARPGARQRLGVGRSGLRLRRAGRRAAVPRERGAGRDHRRAAARHAGVDAPRAGRRPTGADRPGRPRRRRTRAPAVFTRRRPFSRDARGDRHVPRADRDYVRTVADRQPDARLPPAFRDALGRAGIAVSGDIADIDELAAEADRRRAGCCTCTNRRRCARSACALMKVEPEPDRRDAAGRASA